MKRFTPKATKLCPSCPNVDLTLDEPRFNFKIPDKPTAKKETVLYVNTKPKYNKKEALF